MDVLLVLVVLVAAVLLIAAPLRMGRGPAGDEGSPSAQRADLEAAKEAKYREIRDAELDYRTGKLAREDWEDLDRGLRADALELLRRIDELEG
jgi:hypothetical protein